MIRFLCLAALVALSLPLSAQTTTSVVAEPVAATPEASPEVIGTWDYAVESPSGDTGTFTLTGASGAYEGEIVAQGSTLSLSGISFDGSALAFTFIFGSGPVVNITGVVTDGEFAGTADAGAYGSFPMTASRQSE